MIFAAKKAPKFTVSSSCARVTRYDVTKFAGVHPGGTQILLEYAGKAWDAALVSSQFAATRVAMYWGISGVNTKKYEFAIPFRRN